MSKKEVTENILKTGKEVGTDGTKFLTPKGRVMFHNVFKVSDKPGFKPQYKITIGFDKEEIDIEVLKNWADKNIKLFFANKTKGVKNPIKDADQNGQSIKYDSFSNMYYFEAKANVSYPPQVKNQLGKNVTENDQEIYNGCYARLIIDTFAYDKPTNKGISFNLLAVQKIDDGERFGGGETINIDEIFDPLIDNTDISETEDSLAASSPSVNPFI